MSETAVATKPQMPEHVRATLRLLRPSLEVLLPPDIPAEQFRAALYLELQERPELYDCLPESLQTCAIKAATYGLLPGRDCHFLPFRNKRKGGKKEATYVPNYFGIILALERSGKVRRAFAHAVCDGDEFSFDMFADRPKHTPAVSLGRKPGKPLFYYGAVMFHDGTCAFEVLTLDDLDAIKKRSPAGEQSVWLTDEDMMRRKTCIKRVAKYVRLTPALRDMLAEDSEREKNDIPPERHATNVVDLFGDTDEVKAVQQTARNVTPPTDPDPQTTGEEVPEWYLIVKEHGHLATGELAIRVKEAMTVQHYNAEAGTKLAGILLDMANADPDAAPRA